MMADQVLRVDTSVRSTPHPAIALALTMLLGTASLSAQAPTQPAQPTQPPGNQPPAAQDPVTPRLVIEGDSIIISMSETNGLELADFIKWAQELTDRRFTFSDQELANTGQGGNRVTFLGRLPFKKDRFKIDFFAFFQTMLYIKGFAVVPRGSGEQEILEIVAMNGPRQKEVANGSRYVTPEELPDYRNQTGVPILTTVPLKNINATVATNALRPFFASTGSPQGGGAVTLGNVGNNTAMLLCGLQDQVANAIRMVQVADMPGAPETPGTAERLEALSQRVRALEEKLAGKEK